MGQNAGDLLVSVKVGKHSYFKREGFDIHTNQLINISQAVLGSTIEVQTVYGKRKVEVKAGTKAGTVLIIPEHGVQMYPDQYSRGNHCLHLNIKVPGYLTHKQMEIMKAYAQIETPLTIDEPVV
eukprot:TRINITY_DN2022_c0_g1_i1.p2 TRINITY_DN2022_c0_g1~~TRINITY_DN2022_c0_g1_i1.p2  ORF type:complete len:124 (+),score=37.35 TRINITY_DN2022_c0_g1_i1:490-861(+)